MILKKVLALPLYIQTLIAMVLGLVLGIIFGPSISFVGIIAHSIITLIKTFATPLLFVAIIESIVDSQFKGSGIRKLFTVASINAIAAMVLGLIVVNIFKPGLLLKEMFTSTIDTGKLNSHTITNLSWTEALQAFVPESIIAPFLNNQIPAVIILAILIGLAIRFFGTSKKSFEVNISGQRLEISGKSILDKFRVFIKAALGILLQILHFIILLVPLAVLAAVAKAVGQHGLTIFQGLLVYLIACCGGMLIHILVVYQAWIKIFAGRSLREFWSHAKEPSLYAFGINSSLATLPITLQALKDLQVSDGSARLSACLGTNFNNDGILLYQVVAVLMIAQAFSLDMTLSQQITLTLFGLLATLGVAGIPEAGVIALTILLTTAKLPVEVIPLLLTVDWIVARLRSVTNVLGDMTVAIAIDGKARI